MLPTILGGVGLFLIGMLLLTEGLQAVAGDALRSILARFTRTRFLSVVSGAFVTALVQSSSITTLATIGFVSAELLTFSSAIGVIYGANIGTTATSWLVSLIGFKIQIDAFALPMVGVGALLKLFSRGRKASAGMAIAGFGLIFIGIDVLQGGMSGLSEAIDLKQFAGSGVLGRLLLVGVGIVITVMLQSSSAAMATTLTALFAGAITLDQAAALSIGQAVGTTVTAAIGALGASVQAKRTALAHIFFNIGTGVIAFVLLPLFVFIVDVAFDGELSPGNQAISLAAFFTAFKIIGVMVFYPVTVPFADWITRLLPEKHSQLTRRLDEAGLAVPQIAIEAATRTVEDLTVQTAQVLQELLIQDNAFERTFQRTVMIKQAIRDTRAYLREIHSDPTDESQYEKHLATLHALDHLTRVVTACQEKSNYEKYRAIRSTRDEGALLAEGLKTILSSPEVFQRSAELHLLMKDVANHVADTRRRERPLVLKRTAQGKISPDEAAHQLEAMRWLDRFGYHFWRIVVHLSGGGNLTNQEDDSPESELPAISEDELD